MEQRTTRIGFFPLAVAAALALPIGATAQADPCGDINLDGEVNAQDLGILLAAFGVHDGGDLDGDGDTDQQDLVWVFIYFHCGLYGNPPCGLCEPVGTGAIEIGLLPVDNADVGPGDDFEHPEFHGGVTHFTFDIVIDISDDNDWTTQSSFVELLHPDVTFFNHDVGGDMEPIAALLPAFPAIAFDSFYAMPPALFDGESPGFAQYPHWTDTSAEAIWYDASYHQGHTSTIQRLTLIVPPAMAPVVLPDECAQEYVVLAQVSTSGTARSTGADLLHKAFVIVDLNQPICPGDIDDDGDVDQSDLGMLLSTYNLPSDNPLYDNNADLDCDGDVDQSDLGILLAHYGDDC
jgi:hypothetical protein